MSKIVDKIGNFTAIPNSFLKDKRLTVNARCVFLFLRFHTNNNTDTAFPSYDQLEEETGLFRRKLAAAIRELVDTGWLVKQRRFGRSTVYEIQYPATISDDVGTTEFNKSNINELPVSAISDDVGTIISDDVVTTSRARTLLKELDRSNHTQGASERISLAPIPPQSLRIRKRSARLQSLSGKGNGRHPPAPVKTLLEPGYRPCSAALRQVEKLCPDLDLDLTVVQWLGRRLSAGQPSANWDGDFISYCTSTQARITQDQKRFQRKEEF